MCKEDPGVIAKGEAWDFPPAVSIRGLVVPSAWDSEGKVIQVSICCPDEREYRVRQEGLGLRLQEFLHNCVDVTGRLIPDGKGGQEILLARFCKSESSLE